MRCRLVVWYNTKSPVCDGGISWQRSRLVRAARAGAIEFRDINLEPTALARFTYDRFADLLYAWNRRKGHW